MVALAAVSALALHQNAPRAVSPVILRPNAMTLWFLGSVNIVQWYVGSLKNLDRLEYLIDVLSRATDGLELTNMNGTVLMGYVQTNGSVFLWKGTLQAIARTIICSNAQIQ